MIGTAWEVPSPPLPRLEGRVEADVCVIGLGGSGLSALARLQKNRTKRIVGIDAVGIAAGAAGRNGGFLLAGPAPFHHVARRTWGRRAAVDLYGLTVDAIRRLSRRHRDLVDAVGSVRVSAGPEEDADIDAHLAALHDDGFAGSPWSDDRGRRGLFVPDDAVFHPAERCVRLADQVWEAGAWLYGGDPVTAIEGTTVRTARGEIDAGSVLVCVDGGLDRLVPEVADRVRTVRLQMLATGPVAFGTAQHAMYHRSGLDYWQQRPDGRLLVGGCRDAGGASEEGDPPVEPTEVVQQAIERVVREVIGVAPPVTHRWAGRVGFTEDHAPIVEEVRDGVWVAGGYSGTGNVIGTLAGEALADAVTGRPQHPLLDALRAIGG